ncbi:hypothetical protein [Dendronalium sp. ChiSLP03b]|uniref:hypothetical protein n=1 Tax=Dendronalium sp. ChiSLP03b TaxID=3075381 RepID=UPI002AD381F3|nr:hypothetical protein [Dendronalium sp. ChiSLP03b]MDZ8207770.1 hypothetical protein [Dendronalium sp. ChiSLP03b]
MPLFYFLLLCITPLQQLAEVEAGSREVVTTSLTRLSTKSPRDYRYGFGKGAGGSGISLTGRGGRLVYMTFWKSLLKPTRSLEFFFLAIEITFMYY